MATKKLKNCASLLILGIGITLSHCKSSEQTSPLKDAVVVGPNGEVVLFYRDGNNIIIERCSDHAVITKRSDCEKGKIINKTRTTVEQFKRHLNAVLKLSTSDFDAKTTQKVENYKNADDSKSRALEEKLANLTNDLEKIAAFIDFYGIENSDLKKKEALERAIAELKKLITQKKIMQSDIIELNQKIIGLVDQTISDKQLHYFLYSKERHGFVYNILNSYLSTPEEVEVTVNCIPISQSKKVSDFEISTTEITQKQWFSVMGDNPSFHKKVQYCPNDHEVINSQELCPQHPVENISWNDIQIFIEKLNEHSKSDFQLPSSSEWLRAAKAGKDGFFNVGENLSTLKVNFDGRFPHNGSQAGNMVANGLFRNQTVAVASLDNKNAWGLYDMHGNVWEIVGRPIKQSSKDKQNGLPLQFFALGGGFNSPAWDCRYDKTILIGADVRTKDVGFRIIRHKKSDRCQ